MFKFPDALKLKCLNNLKFVLIGTSNLIPDLASSNISFLKRFSSVVTILFSALVETWKFIFLITPFLIVPFLLNGYILSRLAFKVGKVKLAIRVFVFWDKEDVRAKFTLGYSGNVFEYEIDELRVLFKKLLEFSWFTDSWKYLLLPKLTEAENEEFGFDLESLLWDHLILYMVLWL